MARTKRTQAVAIWSALVAEWSRSGEGVAAFCRRRRVAAGSLYRWRQRLKVQTFAKPMSGSMPGFVEIKVAPETPTSVWWYELELRNGRKLRFQGSATGEQVAALAIALEEASC